MFKPETVIGRHRRCLWRACLYCSDVAAQTSPTVDFYGSLRMQAERVSPDRRDRVACVYSLRDAYSRLGVKIDYPLDATLALFGQLELPVDSANLRLRDPYDQQEHLRLARIGLRGQAGTISYGQQWMPYYNAIAAPVDSSAVTTAASRPIPCFGSPGRIVV